MVSVGAGKDGLDEQAAETVTLKGRIDAEAPEVPVRPRRVLFVQARRTSSGSRYCQSGSV